MPALLQSLRANLAYAFIAVGIVWLAVAFFVGPLVLWPVVASLVSGALVKTRPGARLTWAWGTSSAVLGILLSAYAAYVNAFLVGGPFYTIAALSLAVFGAFGIAQVFVLYAAYSPKSKPVK